MIETVIPAETLLATASSSLLKPYGLDTDSLQSVLGQVMSRGVDFADLYFQYSRSEGWQLEEGIVKSGSFSIDQGVGVRAVSGDKTAFAYTDDITLPALQQAAAATRAIAQAGAQARVEVPSLTHDRHGKLQLARSVLYLPHDPLASLQDADKVALLEKIERITRSLDTRVSQVIVSLAGEYDVVLLGWAGGRGRAAAGASVFASYSGGEWPP